MNTSRWWLLAVAVGAALAFSAGRLTSASESVANPLRDVASSSLEWLGLSSAQAAEIGKLQPLYTDSVTSIDERYNQARCQLVHSLTADEWDGAKARSALEEMCATHKANEEATLAYLEQVRQILTPAQRAQLMNRVGTCLCSECAADEGACCVITRDSAHANPETHSPQ